jgi:CheY-like chemotaxis protein
MRVLVVDDDESIRAVLVEALADEGHDVAQAASGAQALTLLQTSNGNGRPDLIVLDLLMPGVDGWDFTAAYRALPPPHAPLLLLTAAVVGPEGTVAGRPLPPAAGTLAKPFTLDDLLALVQRHAGSAPRAS